MQALPNTFTSWAIQYWRAIWKNPVTCCPCVNTVVACQVRCHKSNSTQLSTLAATDRGGGIAKRRESGRHCRPSQGRRHQMLEHRRGLLAIDFVPEPGSEPNARRASTLFFYRYHFSRALPY